MKTKFLTGVYLLTIGHPLIAGTVVLTSLPDDEKPLEPLVSLDGQPLGSDVSIRLGAFPNMSNDSILDAATGGFEAILSPFVPFGEPKLIGEGADGTDGHFEISVTQTIIDSPIAGAEITLLIDRNEGAEFLVARFEEKVFQADTDTGLEQLISLHLADAKIIVGNHYNGPRFVTSPAPNRGSYGSWIAGFSSIADPAKPLPNADADGDGYSNFFEYVTAGNPGSSGDPARCQIYVDDSGDFWVRFSRSLGIGPVVHHIETSSNLADPWQILRGSPQPDPEPPLAESLDWMRMRVPTPLSTEAYFRLQSMETP